jgi:FAD:protein FMN transferase
MKRRRFLQIAAASCASPAFAATPDWQGRGFGADLSLHLSGRGNRAGVLAALPALIARIEADFSLFDPASSLSRLNATGQLPAPSAAFRALLEWSDILHRKTYGSFDPTVQAEWLAIANGTRAARVGWDQITWRDGVTLPPGMSLTLNGLAQGFAADSARQLLLDHGYDQALIDMGEQAAIGGPFRIGIADPAAGIVAERRLANSAMASSSPMATLINGQPHIMHPKGLAPLWSTVSIQASSATLADGLSTAAVFLTHDQLRQIKAGMAGVQQVMVVDFGGSFTSL